MISDAMEEITAALAAAPSATSPVEAAETSECVPISPTHKFGLAVSEGLRQGLDLDAASEAAEAGQVEHPRLHEWAMAAGLADVECEEAEMRPFLQRFATLVLAATPALPQAPAPQAVVGEADAIRNACPRGYGRCGFDAVADACVADGCRDVENLRKFVIALTMPGAKCDELLASIDRLASTSTPTAPQEASELERERAKFQQETRRTSELSRLLKRWVDRHEAEHGPGPWARSCDVCALVGESNALLAKPINEPTPTAPQEADALREALTELIALKDMKERIELIRAGYTFMTDAQDAADSLEQEYGARKPLAWAVARAALAQHQAPQQGEQ